MRTSLARGALLGLGLWAGMAPAQEAGTVRARGDLAKGYCERVRGTASAQAALEWAPEVFGSVGAVNAGDAAGGADDSPLGSPKLRVTAGLGYDFVGLYRGHTLRTRAEAECRRYQALAALQSAVEQGPRLGEAAALEARAKALATSLPRAEQLVAQVRDDLRDGGATLEELNAVQVRLDHLRSLARDTARAREQLALEPAVPEGQNLSVLLSAFEAADDQVEVLTGGLRTADAWRLSVRGGYDEVFDVDQSTPLFGQLTLGYNLGQLWQGRANAQAREGRRQETRDAVDGAPRRVRQLLGELRITEQSERQRLGELSALVSDLQGQLREVEQLQTRQVRRFRDYLLLELARLQAEQAYLSAHLETLRSLLGGTGP
ncbi:hypothetical protein D7X55_25775 [Corallococcus sp. AB049A]|uniref:TolC family protein n=1 Tax=Corallococcus interemptor TaxID=2316720 RepID=A0A3A8QZT2_9BACT|nr:MULTISPECIES: hypothetical protein [Corallococcus]RKH43693.1 hypothetical protein D7Y23_28850 [Corallococcus sp. AB050B]RKH73258.1 hypothetical protein D7X96_02310 [Corallococcus interemptor]RKI59430.1 hypothetical protein D7X55_25775 [Corallococcus sp. AB049A]